MLLVCSEAELHLKADLWVTSVSKTQTLLGEGLESGLRRVWFIHSLPSVKTLTKT